MSAAPATFLGRVAPFVVVLLNLAPLAGVIWLGWDAATVLMLYWAENVVVGLFVAFRILCAGAARGVSGLAGAVGMAAFFVVHYGFFCFGHLFFLAGMFLQDEFAGFPNPVRAMEWLAGQGVGWSLALLALIQVYELVLWLARGGPRRSLPNREMGRAYPRMLLLHVTIIAAGSVVVGAGQPAWAVGILVLLKIAVDIWQIRRPDRTVSQEAAA